MGVHSLLDRKIEDPSVSETAFLVIMWLLRQFFDTKNVGTSTFKVEDWEEYWMADEIGAMVCECGTGWPKGTKFEPTEIVHGPMLFSACRRFEIRQAKKWKTVSDRNNIGMWRSSNDGFWWWLEWAIMFEFFEDR